MFFKSKTKTYWIAKEIDTIICTRKYLTLQNEILRSEYFVTIYTLTSEGRISLLLYPYISYDTTFIFFIKYAPVPSLYSSQVAYPGGAYTSFHSMKWLEVLQLPQGLEWQSIAKLTPPPPAFHQASLTIHATCWIMSSSWFSVKSVPHVKRKSVQTYIDVSAPHYKLR